MSDPPPHLFPTAHRSRHSQSLSYPVGAELLSRALDGVPQHAQLSCDFTLGNVQATDQLFVMSVMYRRRARSFFDGADAGARGVLDARWSITIFTVPRVFRHAIRQGLEAGIIPAVVTPWLVERAQIGDSVGEASLMVTFDTVTRRLSTSSRDNLEPARR
jgi:hypothetical protein